MNHPNSFLSRRLLITGLVIVFGCFQSSAQQGMGVGTNNPLEMMQVEGAIKIGTDFNNSNAAPTGGAGTIRWNGTNFQGWDGTQWIDFTGSGAAGWELTGNAGTVPGTNFIGTSDNVDLRIRTNNTDRIAVLANGNIGIGTNTAVCPITYVPIGIHGLKLGEVLSFSEIRSETGKMVQNGRERFYGCGNGVKKA
jgi:hypothetical protein